VDGCRVLADAIAGRSPTDRHASGARPLSRPKAPAGQKPAFVLMLFVITHSLLSVDRGIMGILAEPVKHDFQLSDGQLGLLTGFAFAIFFGIGGIPIGILVDRMSRKHILAASVFVFSAMTAMAAAAGSFVQLLLTRSLVGAGEAGGTPSMGSMLSDVYPPERRAQAMAIFYAGNPLGVIVAFLVGGAVAAQWGWRATVVVVGLPGVLVAAALLLFLREPERRVDGGGGAKGTAPSFGETVRFIGRQRALRHIMITPILTSAASAGLFSFAGSFFLRTHHLTLPQVGLLLAVFYGTLGAIGTILCGRLAEKLGRRDESWLPRFCALANVLAALAVPLLALSPSLPAAVIGLGLYAVATTGTYGPLLAMLQSSVGARMRGTVTAIFYFLSYLLGSGSGPFMIGTLSDWLAPGLGADSLRYAILLAGVLYAWGALHFWLAARNYKNDIEVARRIDAARA